MKSPVAIPGIDAKYVQWTCSICHLANVNWVDTWHNRHCSFFAKNRKLTFSPRIKYRAFKSVVPILHNCNWLQSHPVDVHLKSKNNYLVLVKVLIPKGENRALASFQWTEILSVKWKAEWNMNTYTHILLIYIYSYISYTNVSFP